MSEGKIIIRGVAYSSQLDASVTLGVSTGTLARAKKAGRLDYVGLGLSGAAAKRRLDAAETRAAAVSAQGDLGRMIRMAARENEAMRAHWRLEA